MAERKEKKKTNQKKKVYTILALLCLIVAVICGVVSVMEHQKKKAAEEALEQLQQEQAVQEALEKAEEEAAQEAETEPEEEPETNVLEEKGITIPEKELDFTRLQTETNEDIYAWITIPGTKVDYPILCHPGEDSYYLDRNLDGSRGYPGCIYTDPINTMDFSDPNTVIYGHNMKDKTMFGSLHSFRDREFFDENRNIFIYTEEKVYVYDIFAAYEYSDIHLIYNFDLSNDEIFENYLQQILEIRDMNCNLSEGVELSAEDRIVTLSTCIGGKPNNRYLVQGVLLYEGAR